MRPAVMAAGIVAYGISMNFTAVSSPPFWSIQARGLYSASVANPGTAITLPARSLAVLIGEFVWTTSAAVGVADVQIAAGAIATKLIPLRCAFANVTRSE